MIILITSVGTSTSVNLIRYFKKMNIKIVGTDTNRYGLTAGSQLVDSFAQVPVALDAGYFEAINNVIDQYKVDLLIPINDMEVYIVSQKINQLHCKCIVPSVEKIRIFTDKLEGNKRVRKLGIPVSDILNEDDIHLKRILRDKTGVGSKGIEILDKGVKKEKFDSQKSFLQKFINGKEYTVDVLSDKKGNPIYIIPRERLEVKSGVATKALIQKEETLIGYVKKIAQEFHIPGFFNVQFIKDENGVCWFIELNPRFSGCGAATLATVPEYLNTFIDVVSNDEVKIELNRNVRWNSLITRYYEEIVYEESIC